LRKAIRISHDLHLRSQQKDEDSVLIELATNGVKPEVRKANSRRMYADVAPRTAGGRPQVRLAAKGGGLD
jgi:hypothetical protein